MANPVTEVKNRVDWSLVVTLIVSALILGAIFYGMKNSGVKVLKQVAEAA